MVPRINAPCKKEAFFYRKGDNVKKKSRIYIFKDQEDYIKKITDDNIYNITGEKGSGKTFHGITKDNNIVVHLDNVYEPIAQKGKHEYSGKVRKVLIKNLGENLKDYDFETKAYPVIINYVKNEKKKVYIEGLSIADIKNINNIKGTVIVKRIGVLKCFIRTLKRDYHNEYFMNIEIKKYGRFGKVTRLFKITKRRLKIFKTYHNIEHFIDRLDKY